MRLHRLLVSLFVFSCCFCIPKASAKTPYRYDASNSQSDLWHAIENHEMEIHTIEERIQTQETILDTLREQLLDVKLSHKEIFKGNSVSLEKKTASLDLNVSQMSSDIKQLQSHANETAKVLSQYKQKITELEGQLVKINKAMDSLLIALKIEEPNDSKETSLYVVKPGDSLDKIARKNKISIKRLKELNSLENDRIYTGQKLKIQ